MNKRGFTLAEVLVTLGIIGVVSALTIPSFTARTNAAKIGPALSKAVAVFEQASQQVLSEANSDSLLDAMVCADGSQTCAASTSVTSSNSAFWSNFGHYIKGSYNSTSTSYTSADGISYSLGGINSNASGNFPAETSISDNCNSTTLSGCFMIDINGASAPNRDALDRFYFVLRNDGSLKPVGSEHWQPGVLQIANHSWTDKCNKDSIPTDAKYCSGHIFENNLKVDYKF